MVKDPVCGMDVDQKNAVATADYDGKTYYFCCDGCKVNFLQLPELYVKSQQTKG